MATNNMLWNSSSFDFNFTAPYISTESATTCPVCKTPTTIHHPKFGHLTPGTNSNSGSGTDVDGCAQPAWNPTTPFFFQASKAGDPENDVIMGDTCTAEENPMVGSTALKLPITFANLQKLQDSFSTGTADQMDIGTAGVSVSLFPGFQFTGVQTQAQTQGRESAAIAKVSDDDAMQIDPPATNPFNLGSTSSWEIKPSVRLPMLKRKFALRSGQIAKRF
ncbi:hypothetical protein BDW74DRAFT_175215 [Aspergillus multicolor]|uniref:uncharacterized protein n=1 Tax=Aspergillus multicolor TaxID=41759 RepID=UPI003CCD5921